jgi:hypothetical protein
MQCVCVGGGVLGQGSALWVSDGKLSQGLQSCRSDAVVDGGDDSISGEVPPHLCHHALQNLTPNSMDNHYLHRQLRDRQLSGTRTSLTCQIFRALHSFVWGSN